MTDVIRDRVHETGTGTTGAFALLGPVAPSVSFSRIGNGNTCMYHVEDADGTKWGTFRGVWTTGGNLSRAEVIETSAGVGVDVAFSGGTHTIRLVVSSRSIADIYTAIGAKQDSLGFTPYNATNPAGYLAAAAVAALISASAPAFAAADFNVSGVNVSIDYANGQKATSGQPGFLTAADWSAFNGKVDTAALAAYAPLAGAAFTGPISVAGTANLLTLAGASTGNPVTLTATGTDADINIALVPKGDNGRVIIGPALAGSEFGPSAGGLPLTVSTTADYANMVIAASSDGYAGAQQTWAYIAASGDVDPGTGGAATPGDAYFLGAFYAQMEDTTVQNSIDWGIVINDATSRMPIQGNGVGDLGLGMVFTNYSGHPTPIVSANITTMGGTGNTIFGGGAADDDGTRVRVKGSFKATSAVLTSLTASQVVLTDASKNLVSGGALGSAAFVATSAFDAAGAASTALAAALSADYVSPLTTKGDLLGFSTVLGRLGVGADGEVLTADAASTFGFKWAAAAGGVSAPLTLSPAANAKGLILASATHTTNAPWIDAAQTWNASGTTFVGALFNVTKTANAAASKLFAFQNSGTDVFALRHDGALLGIGGYASSSWPALRGLSGSPPIMEFVTSDAGGYCTGRMDTLILTGASITGVSSTKISIGGITGGVVEINNGSNGTLRDLHYRNVVGQSGYTEMAEMTAPGAGAANTARIYAEDNGGGKTRLMAIFQSGASQQLAIEP